MLNNFVMDKQNRESMTLSVSWWHHQTKAFSTFLAFCAGNSPVTGEFPTQRPVTWSFNVFIDLHLNQQLSKQGRHWWFETPSCSLWRHCNGTPMIHTIPLHQGVVYTCYIGPCYTRTFNHELKIKFNTLRQRQNGRYFPDDFFKCIFLNAKIWYPIKISLKFVPKVPINNMPALVQIMAWRQPGDKPLFEPVVVSLLTHICVTRPQWVNSLCCPHIYP